MTTTMQRPILMSSNSAYTPLDSPFVSNVQYVPPSPVYFQGDGYPFPRTPPKASEGYLSKSVDTSGWSSSSSDTASVASSQSSFASNEVAHTEATTSFTKPPFVTSTSFESSIPKSLPSTFFPPSTPHVNFHARTQNAGSTPGCPPPRPMPQCRPTSSTAGKENGKESETIAHGVPDGWATLPKKTIDVKSPPASRKRNNPLAAGLSMSAPKLEVEWKHGHLTDSGEAK
ncbi:hypothetical protein P7C70_g2320, partial [Phenoliferia sp. Uapishka_3]